MAQIYVKVPHYVASFWRNRDEAHPVMPWEAVDLSGYMRFRQIVDGGLMRNEDLRVVTTKRNLSNACFCEYHWKEMMKGRTIFENVEGKIGVKMMPTLQRKDMRSVAEVCVLSGKRVPKTASAMEYLCIGIPNTWHNDERRRWEQVDATWQLTAGGADSLAVWLKRSVEEKVLKMKARDEERCRNAGVAFNMLDFIERFMMRYEIRNSNDNHEKNTIKKMIQRAEK